MSVSLNTTADLLSVTPDSAPAGVVFKVPFHDPNFIGIFAPDSAMADWSNGYRI
jgi:hypothetical protein